MDSISTQSIPMIVGNTVPFQANNPPKPFLITELAKSIFIALATTFAAIGVTGAILCAFAPLVPTGLSMLIASIASLTILNLGLIAEIYIPKLPDSIRGIARHVQSFIREIFADIAKIPLAFIDLTKTDPKTAEEINPNETPILFIHGFLGSSNTWIYPKSRLSTAGYKNLFTINLGGPSLTIPEYAKKVDDKIEEIKKLTGRDDIRLICHSMGGLVARDWLYKINKDTNVRDVITIGSPLKGTEKARYTLGLSPSGMQMYPESDLIKEQHELAANHPKTNFYHIGSSTDLVIEPSRSAYEGNVPEHKVKTDTLDATGHGTLTLSDTVADLVINYLQEQDRKILEEASKEEDIILHDAEVEVIEI